MGELAAAGEGLKELERRVGAEGAMEAAGAPSGSAATSVASVAPEKEVRLLD